ncbi:nucleotidyl transferase AbiEii/AbiGii toxin family protein [Deinococcus fonticola]|uniref:nucleotidyl transferase AbiEii/AbiGii toxin family protein n=1 Tax=Deinococcus fonticola TaxID=2528713 RepID=UPI0010756026|nr:nucleotidyl transferase AbiEii/AbiGii toxin family protein [Deinococcus fonticola]
MPSPTALIEQAALELQPLLERLVFVGGATVELLLTDKAAGPVRPTNDVDVATHVSRRSELSKLEERLTGLGFEPDQEGPLCRWKKGSLVLDVMTDDGEMQGFTNPWYASAIQHARQVTLPSGRTVRVLDAPHLIATKLVAWRDRGQGSMFSHDLEDILMVLDGRPELSDELRAAPPPLQDFVRQEFASLLAHPDFEETLQGTFTEKGRDTVVLERVRVIAVLTPGP